MLSGLDLLAPFNASLPRPPRPANGTAQPGAGATPTEDPVAVATPPRQGAFTAAAGDVFSIRTLLDLGAGGLDGAALFRVALGHGPSPPEAGRLLLRGADVSARSDFTAAEFNELQFAAGGMGSRTDLLVVARQGRPDGSGGLTGIADSVPVLLTASVTGRRSLDALPALRTEAGAREAAFVRIAQEAAIFDGLGAERPSLDAVGNFTTAAGATYALRELFNAGAGAFDRLARYRVALRQEPGADPGRLSLRGVDVSDRTDFTPAEFNELQFIAGADGAATDLLVVARRARVAADGTLSGIVDSAAVQITATTTGTVSGNAAAALRSAPPSADAAFVRIAQDAAVFDGLGAERPNLATVGDLAARPADQLALRDLYDAGPDAFDRIARYRVALRAEPGADASGRLTLDGADVTSRTDFTPAEFNRLQFVAGDLGTRTELLVVARTGRADATGALNGIIDSVPATITVATAATRSLNAATALRTPPGDADATAFGLVRDADTFDGLGKPRPTLATIGNLTAAAGDDLALRDLFDAGPDAFDRIARYRVALRETVASPDGARLLLEGRDVSDRTDFTPAEFNQLQLRLGSSGSVTELVVVARQGTPDGSGGLTKIIDSPAVQITAAVTGTRSLAALAAMRTVASSVEAARARLVQDSDIYDGLGASRPALTTVGNFTAAAADAFGLRQLFDAGPDAFDTIERYRVALSEPGPGGARLMLRGADVSVRTDFTPAEFNELLFEAGTEGTAALLTVVARTGTPDGVGGLTRIVDSAAVEISATVTGARSLNAVPALRAEPGTGADAAFLRLAQDAAIFDGLGRTRPSLGTVLGAADPFAAFETLATALATFRSFGGSAPEGARDLADLAALYGRATGSLDRLGVEAPDLQVLRGLVMQLDAGRVGAWQQAGGERTTLALAAYARNGR